MSNQYGPKIVTNNLIKCFDAANPKSYPGSGNLWYDLIDGSSITLSNLNSYENNLALNTRSRIFTVIPFTFNSNMTFEIWYRTYTPLNSDGIFSGSPPIMQIGNYNTNTSFTLWDVVSATSRRVVTYINNGSTWTSIPTSPSYTGNTWLRYHHILMMFSGSGNWSNYKLYIDTNLITNYNLPNPTSSIGGGNNLIITGGSGGQPSLNNSYSTIRIYNSALSNSEILQNYNALKGRFQL